ncbi:MAG: ATP-binding protein [Acidobacteria bacterium]|nr:ATP-binding protein [Acidobacteriota bacterium]
MSRNILIIDDHDDLATALSKEFSDLGYFVESTQNRDDAVNLAAARKFDMVITDLDGKNLIANEDQNCDELPCLPNTVERSRSDVKAFKICLANYDNQNFDENEINHLVKTTLNYKAKFIDRGEAILDRHEKIDFEVPSTIVLMHDILDYLMKRVEKLGVVNPEQSNLFVALDEAFVNAVKHGNKFDTSKLVKISVEISPQKASFTIEDEGDGFDVNTIPNPTDPENLFKASGRGVMFIYNIMDEVSYNERGNRLTMVKKSEKSKNL